MIAIIDAVGIVDHNGVAKVHISVVVKSPSVLGVGSVAIDRRIGETNIRSFLGHLKSTASNLCGIVSDRHIRSGHRRFSADHIESRSLVGLVVFDRCISEVQRTSFVNVETSPLPADGGSCCVGDLVPRDRDHTAVIHVHRRGRGDVTTTTVVLRGIVTERQSVFKINGNPVVKTETSTDTVGAVAVDRNTVESGRGTLAPDVDTAPITSRIVRDRSTRDRKVGRSSRTENSAPSRRFVSTIARRAVVGEIRVRRDDGLAVVEKTSTEGVGIVVRGILNFVVVNNHVSQGKNITVVINPAPVSFRNESSGHGQVLDRDIRSIGDVENPARSCCVDHRRDLVAALNDQVLVDDNLALRKSVSH